MKTCSKCKCKKPLASFNRNRSQKDGYQTFCRSCEKERKKEYYKNNKEKFLGYNQIRRAKAKRWFTKYKRGLSCTCGENHPACLDFHHGRGDKVAGVAQLAHHFCNIEKLKIEIDKCIVLCSNCHRKLHYEEGLVA